MEREEHYLHLSSKDSLNYYPHNKGNNFTIKLPGALQLIGSWKCALTEISFINEFEGKRPDDIFICTDMIEDSYGRDSFRSLLRKISLPASGTGKIQYVFPQNYYIKVAREEVQYLYIYIKDEDFQDVSFLKEPVTCTLHIIRTN